MSAEPVQRTILLGENMDDGCWIWTELEQQALKQMHRDKWNVWDMAKELGRKPTHVALAILIWGEEGVL